MIVAGLGFRHGVSADEIVDAIEQAVRRQGLDLGQLRKLATIAARSDEPGLLEAAGRLGLGVEAIDPQRLSEQTSQLSTHSTRVLDLYGVGSVCEAAALAAAGDGARLTTPRVATSRATCALAEGSGP